MSLNLHKRYMVEASPAALQEPAQFTDGAKVQGSHGGDEGCPDLIYIIILLHGSQFQGWGSGPNSFVRLSGGAWLEGWKIER